MDISFDELLHHSFVITLHAGRWNAFVNRWRSHLPPEHELPARFRGFRFPVGANEKLQMAIRTKQIQHQIGCGLSHYVIICMAKALGWPYVTIFEDDAILSDPGAFRDLADVLKDIPDDISMLKLGYDYKGANKVRIPDHNPHIVDGDRTLTSHAYIVFSQYYDTYIELFEKYDFVADLSVMNREFGPSIHRDTTRSKIFRTRKNFFYQRPAEEPLKNPHPVCPPDILLSDFSFSIGNDVEGKRTIKPFAYDPSGHPGDRTRNFTIGTEEARILVTALGIIKIAEALHWPYVIIRLPGRTVTIDSLQYARIQSDIEYNFPMCRMADLGIDSRAHAVQAEYERMGVQMEEFI